MNSKIKRNIMIGFFVFICLVFFVKPIRYIVYGVGGIFLLSLVIIVFVLVFIGDKLKFEIFSELFRFIQKKQDEKELQIKKNNNVINDVEKFDRNFSYEEFKKIIDKVMPLYLKSRNYDENVIDELRMYASKSFIDDYVKELQIIKNQDKYQYTTPQILDVSLGDAYKDGKHVLIKTVVTLQANISKYNDQKILIKQSTENQIYHVTFVKTQENTSISQDQDVLVNCPNCGATVDILNDKYCTYCGSAIYEKRNIWVLHNVTQYHTN